MNNLAACYELSGDLDNAKKLYEDSMRLRKVSETKKIFLNLFSFTINIHFFFNNKFLRFLMVHIA